MLLLFVKMIILHFISLGFHHFDGIDERRFQLRIKGFFHILLIIVCRLNVNQLFQKKDFTDLLIVNKIFIWSPYKDHLQTFRGSTVRSLNWFAGCLKMNVIWKSIVLQEFICSIPKGDESQGYWNKTKWKARMQTPT